MSASPPSPLPAHLRPIPVEIPATWTPEQALAELVGVAQPGRARACEARTASAGQALLLKRQLSFPVSMMSQ